MIAELTVSPIEHSTFYIHHSTFRAAAVDIHAIERFKQDPRINDLLRTGDTIGCFYVESPAMRMLLKKLEVTDYPTLVAATAASYGPAWRRAA